MTEIVTSEGALTLCLAPRAELRELPGGGHPCGTRCWVGSELYVFTGSRWDLFSEADLRTADVECATKTSAYHTEIPLRWRCRLSCGCTVATPRESYASRAPESVTHWCRPEEQT